MNMFDEYDDYIEKLLKLQYEASEIIKHNLTRGEVREYFIIEQIEKQFKSLECHRGFIGDLDSEYQSSQLDIITVSKNDNPRIRKIGDNSIISIGDAKIVIEVKSSPKTSELKALDDLSRKLKALDPESNLKIGMFIYKYKIQKKNMLKKFGFNYDKVIRMFDDDGTVEYKNIDFIVALDVLGEEKEFFLIKDKFSQRFTLMTSDAVTKPFFNLFSNI